MIPEAARIDYQTQTLNTGENENKSHYRASIDRRENRTLKKQNRKSSLINMSRITNTALSLTEIIEESNLILEVKCIEPYTEEIIIKPGDSNLTPPPPFLKQGFLFELRKVLKNTARLEVPETLRIPQEQWRRSLDQHKATYGNGLNKSYNVKTYQSDIKSMNKASIIFLHHFQGIYELTAKNSFTSAAEHEKVTMLLGNN